MALKSPSFGGDLSGRSADMGFDLLREYDLPRLDPTGYAPVNVATACSVSSGLTYDEMNT